MMNRKDKIVKIVLIFLMLTFFALAFIIVYKGSHKFLIDLTHNWSIVNSGFTEIIIIFFSIGVTAIIYQGTKFNLRKHWSFFDGGENGETIDRDRLIYYLEKKFHLLEQLTVLLKEQEGKDFWEQDGEELKILQSNTDKLEEIISMEEREKGK